MAAGSGREGCNRGARAGSQRDAGGGSEVWGTVDRQDSTAARQGQAFLANQGPGRIAWRGVQAHQPELPPRPPRCSAHPSTSSLSPPPALRALPPPPALAPFTPALAPYTTGGNAAARLSPEPAPFRRRHPRPVSLRPPLAGRARSRRIRQAPCYKTCVCAPHKHSSRVAAR